APYMHFPNRDALLAAIAQLGFQKLAAVTRPLAELEDLPWRQRFQLGCAAYVEFSVDNPELFRVMFMEHNAASFPGYLTDSLGALQVLSDSIEAGQREGFIKAGSVALFTNFVCSSLQGLAVLRFDRNNDHVPFAGSTTEQLAHDFVALMLDGISA
ncbi:MAG: hypothetical protein AAGG11_22390, partial [Pseudomonadota bacterium]